MQEFEEKPKMEAETPKAENPLVKAVQEFMDAGEMEAVRVTNFLKNELGATDADVKDILSAINSGESRVTGWGYDQHEAGHSDEGFRVNYDFSDFRDGLKGEPNNIVLYIQDSDGTTAGTNDGSVAVEIRRPKHNAGRASSFDFTKKVYETRDDADGGDRWVEVDLPQYKSTKE